MSSKSQKEIKLETRHIVAIFIGVLLLFLSFWGIIDFYIIKECIPDASKIRGEFGDKFGAINALFSAFAFAGIIITIVLQSQELKLQRKELEETREVFQSQKIIMEEQNIQSLNFALLNNFEHFKTKNNIDSIVDQILSAFFLDISSRISSQNFTNSNTNAYTEQVLDYFTTKLFDFIKMQHSANLIISYLQFANNLLHTFQKNEKTETEYTALLYIQLNHEGKLLLFMTCGNYPFGFPINYVKRWSIYEAQYLLKKMIEFDMKVAQSPNFTSSTICDYFNQQIKEFSPYLQKPN